MAHPKDKPMIATYDNIKKYDCVQFPTRRGWTYMVRFTVDGRVAVTSNQSASEDMRLYWEDEFNKVGFEIVKRFKNGRMQDL